MASDDDKRLGKYLLKSKLGQGGMGVVYLATDTRLKRDVALKVLSKELSSNEDAVKRFVREARAAARLNHPNVVAVYDVDQQRGFCFLVMELVSGCTASELVRQGPLNWPEATRLIAEACRGLAAAHDAGLVHRDIKPSNLMRTHDGLVKLADFGLAKTTDDLGQVKNPLTQSGTILGTPHYMSPEQCRGEPVDARSDLYSLGATYFTLLTGQAPFEDSNPLQVMFSHCSKPTPDPRSRRDDLPPACAEIAMKAMAKNRVERFASAKEMLVALMELLAMAPRADTTASFVPLTSAVLLNEGSPTQAINVTEPIGSTIRLSPWRKLSASRRALALSIISGVLLVASAVLWNSSGQSGSTGGKNASSTSREMSPETPLTNGQRATSLELLVRFSGITSEVRGVTFSDDGKSVFTGSRDGRVREWSLSEKRVVRELLSSPQAIHAVAASHRWLVAGGDDRVLWLCSLNAEQPPIKLAELAGEVQSLAVSPNGERLAVGTSQSVELFELTKTGGRLIRQVAIANDRHEFVARGVHCVAFSSDSRWLAATSWEKQLGVWETTDGTLRAAQKKLAHELMSVAFVPGRERLLFGANHIEGLFVWDFAVPNSETRSLTSSRNRGVRAMAVTSQDVAFVNGEWDGAVRVYDIGRDELLDTAVQSTYSGVSDLAISRDGRFLATCGGDEGKPSGDLLVWSIVSDKKAATKKTP